MYPVSCLIVFRSMTHAQNAAAILRRNGISAALVKPPVSLGRGSCAFGLVIRDEYLSASLHLMQKTSGRFVGVYEQCSGGWREVLL